MSKYSARLIFFPLICSIFAGSCTGPLPEEKTQPEVVSPATYQELRKAFASHGYGWNTIGRGVPPLILERLPGDLGRISQVTEKKRAFFLSLLPMVLMANEEIRREREMLERLFRLQEAGLPPGHEERSAIASIARKYGVAEDPLASSASRRELLKRIDIVPPSMALAQSAAESGYGTSRFALQGNNLFGEWTFTPGTGLVPEQRPAGEIYEVRRFDTLYDSVKSYMKNLNTHRAYRLFRERRAELRAAALPLRGMDLAATLRNYSGRREAYVADIKSIIRRNRLSHLASATLRQPITSSAPAASPSGLLAGRAFPNSRWNASTPAGALAPIGLRIVETVRATD